MYSYGNPYYTTIFYDDPNTDENSTVLFIGEKNQNGIWVNLNRFYYTVPNDYPVDLNGYSHFCCNISVEEDMKEYLSYDGKTGNAALIYDSGYYLRGKEIKLLYIP